MERNTHSHCRSQAHPPEIWDRFRVEHKMVESEGAQYGFAVNDDPAVPESAESAVAGVRDRYRDGLDYRRLADGACLSARGPGLARQGDGVVATSGEYAHRPLRVRLLGHLDRFQADRGGLVWLTRESQWYASGLETGLYVPILQVSRPSSGQCFERYTHPTPYVWPQAFFDLSLVKEVIRP